MILRICIILTYGRRGLDLLGLFTLPRMMNQADIKLAPIDGFFLLLYNFFACSESLPIRSISKDQWG